MPAGSSQRHPVNGAADDRVLAFDAERFSAVEAAS
jgi:hypothetical protein